MIAIGERINGMFTDIKNAIAAQDKGPVQMWAKKQLEHGADYLDVNVGTASKTPAETIKWLVQAIAEAVPDAPIALDSPKMEVMKAGLEACKQSGIKKILINSTTGQMDKLQAYFPLVNEYNASIITLAMDERGIPKDVDYRVEVGATIIATAMEFGIDPERIFLDPICMPVKHAQVQQPFILEAVRQFTMICDPRPHITCGLSNTGQGTLKKELVNATILALLIGAGLDSAIVDVCDEHLMHSMITTELLLGNAIYSDDYIKAYMQRAR